MSFCHNCGMQLGEANFCPNCGAPRQPVPGAPRSPYDVGNLPPPQPQMNPPARPMPNKTVMIVVAIAVVIIVVVACLLSGSFGGSPKVRIIYDGSWEGVIGDDSGQRSVDGYGDRTYDMSGGIVVAVIQKMDGGGGTLTVQILSGLGVVEEQSTDSEYGVVTVSHSF